MITDDSHDFLGGGLDLINFLLLDIDQTHDDMMKMFLYVFLGDQNYVFELLEMF